MMPKLYNPPTRAEKKMTEGNIWKERTNPIEEVPSANIFHGLRARGPNKKSNLFERHLVGDQEIIDPFRAVLDPEKKSVKAPNTHVREMLPTIVSVLILMQVPDTHAILDITKKPISETKR
jgi:hypothetical protein